MLLVMFGIMAVLAGGGVYLAERVDRPRRRALREAELNAAE